MASEVLPGPAYNNVTEFPKLATVINGSETCKQHSLVIHRPVGSAGSIAGTSDLPRADYCLGEESLFRICHPHLWFGIFGSVLTELLICDM